jgi:hypothetical protein
MEALRGLASTGRSTGDCNCTRVTENGAKAGVRRGRRGGEAGTGSVEVSGKGAGQIKAEELGSSLSRGATSDRVYGYDSQPTPRAVMRSPRMFHYC